MEKEFTHFDNEGNAVMVDITEKKTSQRTARAMGSITVNRAVINAIENKSSKKGDVLGVARIAGIMALKRTAELIPLCHLLLPTKIAIDFTVDAELSSIDAFCTVKLNGNTGAEMEALTGVSVALLTVYDMCKALDKNMVIQNIHLIEKSGGTSGGLS